jgi:hypothetical protein
LPLARPRPPRLRPSFRWRSLSETGHADQIITCGWYDGEGSRVSGDRRGPRRLASDSHAGLEGGEGRGWRARSSGPEQTLCCWSTIR